VECLFPFTGSIRFAPAPIILPPSGDLRRMSSQAHRPDVPVLGRSPRAVRRERRRCYARANDLREDERCFSSAWMERWRQGPPPRLPMRSYAWVERWWSGKPTSFLKSCPRY
jgi:hypothetical protein